MKAILGLEGWVILELLIYKTLPRAKIIQERIINAAKFVPGFRPISVNHAMQPLKIPQSASSHVPANPPLVNYHFHAIIGHALYYVSSLRLTYIQIISNLTFTSV